MEATDRGQKRGVYWGRYYRPDPRARKTQKSCRDVKCRAKRKRESQRKWTEVSTGMQWRRIRTISRGGTAK